MAKTVLITGSSKGLGRMLALSFAKRGYNITLHGRNKFCLNNVKAEIIRNKVQCDIVSGDLQKIQTIEELAKVAREKNIEILINNAGVKLKDDITEVSDDKVDNLIAVNLSSLIKLTRRIYSFFLEKSSGIIININSLGGIYPAENRALYSASKYGLKGFTDCLRIAAKSKNIRIIGVYPGTMLDEKKLNETAELILNAVINPADTDEIIIN